MAIAEMYFRMDVSQLEHSRTVFKLMDWLGAIGGVEFILKVLFGFFVSGYINFNSDIVTLNLQK